MTSRAADRAMQAADALDAFVLERSRWPEAVRGEPGPPAPSPAPAANAVLPDGQSGSTASANAPRPDARVAHNGGDTFGRPLALPHPDWLHHRLTVTGAPNTVKSFRAAAAGAGLVPWHLDLDRLEEDWRNRLLGPGRTLSLFGAKTLARQLRDAVERRDALAIARVGISRACPFDLHALVPVPAAVLHLGPDDPASLAWLWTHWGTTHALRRVRVEAIEPGTRAAPPPGLARSDLARVRYTFWSADWTPWQALRTIQADWPSLRWTVHPSYDDR